MKRVTVDASAAVAWLVRQPATDAAQALLADGSVRLIAPDLLFLEAANALRSMTRFAGLPAADALAAIEDLVRFDIEQHAARDLASDALALALEIDASAYDCAYLALAVRERAPLVTADRKLAARATAAGLAAHVRLLG